MSRELREWRRFLHDESGPEIIEWVVVTVILILAIYAILQAVGPELVKFVHTVTEWVRSMIRGR